MLTKQDEKTIKNVVEDAIVNSFKDTFIPAMEAMHTSLNGRIDDLENKMDGRFEKVEQKLDRTYDVTLVQGNKMADYEKRIGKLEKSRFLIPS